MLFRETIRESAEAESKWVRHLGGRSEYAHVKVLLEPLPRGSGIHLASIDEQFFPAEYFPGVEQGWMSALASGVAARYEVTDVQATVTGGSYHEVDSCIHAFSQATEDAVRKALRAAQPFLLEEAMQVAIKAPEHCMGAIIGSANQRRGVMESVEHITDSGDTRMLIGISLPRMELADFEREFNDMVPGQGSFSSTPKGFQELPGGIAAKLQFCSGCERKVLPRGTDFSCPDCGLSLGSGDDYSVA